MARPRDPVALRRILGARQSPSHGGPTTSTGGDTSATGERDAADIPPDLPEQLRDLTRMLGRASVREILELVEPGWADDLARLRLAVEAGSADAIRDAAHKLRGSAGMCGLEDLARAADALERGATRGAALAPELAELEARLATAIPRIRAWAAALG